MGKIYEKDPRSTIKLYCVGLFYQRLIYLFQDKRACFTCCLHIDDALVAAAAKGQREITLGFIKTSVDQDVDFGEQCIHIRIVHLLQFLEGITAVGPDIEMMGMELLGQFGQRPWLAKRLPPAEGNAGKQDVVQDMCEELVRICKTSCSKIVGLRVVAASAMVGTALCEDGEAVAIAIDHRVVDCTGNLNGGHVLRDRLLRHVWRCSSDRLYLQDSL